MNLDLLQSGSQLPRWFADTLAELQPTAPRPRPRSNDAHIGTKIEQRLCSAPDPMAAKREFGEAIRWALVYSPHWVSRLTTIRAVEQDLDKILADFRRAKTQVQRQPNPNSSKDRTDLAIIEAVQARYGTNGVNR